MELIDKEKIVAEIKGYIFNYKEIVAKTNRNDSTWVDSVSMINAKIDVLQHVLFFLDTLEVKEVDLEEENENNNPKITAGTKIRLKTNPNIILSIISNDCHEDEFECSNGSVLSLKQIEKYYDIYIKEK